MLFSAYYKNIFKEDLNKFFSMIPQEEKNNTKNPIEIFVGGAFPNGITHYLINNTFFTHLNFVTNTQQLGFQYISGFEHGITVKSYKFTKSHIDTYYSKMHFKNSIGRSYFLISLHYIITLDQFFHYNFGSYGRWGWKYNKFRILTNYPKYITHITKHPEVFKYNKYSHENPGTLLYDTDFMTLHKTTLAEIRQVFKDEFFEFINNWELNYRALNLPEEYFLWDDPIVQNDIDSQHLWELFIPNLPKGIAKEIITN
jgi:hypothetical protein